MTDKGSSRSGSWFQGYTGAALIVFLAVAAFFLLTEHRAHLFGILPYLLLLACPLMHWLMNGGHGEEHRRSPEEDKK